ncbi:site-specific integrase [Sulfitobacter pontiacus]|uniref:site-specific integrase n=1 Tax=Sulfitobacter pontiacus TaxID=60137 RepID=UPI0015DFBD7E|nr:site-specific integrase [Sulfitobacter pontiacus]QLL42055.1 site-specific integrase [Sulfitobacter pontiacus]
MTGLNYVTRRGAIYVWRRRLPACVSQTSYLQISLRTPRFSTAKILANLVNAAFATCISGMKSQRITQAEAQRFLSDLVVQQLEKIEEERYYEPDAPSPKDWRQRYLNERARAVAARLVAARGGAADLFPEDVADLKKEGFSERDIDNVRNEVAVLKAEITTQTYKDESQTMAETALGRPDCDTFALRKVGMLRLLAEAEALERSDRRSANTVSTVWETATRKLPEPQAALEPLRAETNKRYSAEMTSIVADYIAGRDRAVDDLAEQKKITKDVTQQRAILSQFAEATKVEKLTDLRQEDLYYYVSVLERLPKIYRKNAEDQARTLEEILERAEELPADQIGLAPATINRNVTALQGFLKFAKSRGTKPAEELDLSSLRKPCGDNERSARLAFSEDDMAKITSHPVWTGCQSSVRRNEKGAMIITDGLYWGPIVASLSGTRREEIMGMTLDEVDLTHKHPHLHIRKNRNRRLKNAASERLVPLHEALAQLGFHDYVADLKARGEVDLFPELKPQNENGSFGDVFYGKWKQITDSQLGERAQRRTFHSFRHRFISVLRHDTDVPKELVQDLVGHKHQDETDGRYRKMIDFRDQILEKLAPVVNQVPADAWLNTVK